MSFWKGYLSSLKPLDVEEPIDVWFHRPLGYILAKICFYTPISPNAITIFSILCGIVSGFFYAKGQLWIGSLVLLFATALDCADGQLARMRKSYSVFGRMLDGIADSVTIFFVTLGTLWFLFSRYEFQWKWMLFFTILGIGVAYTSSLHCSAYDYYKNLYLRFALQNIQETETIDEIHDRYITFLHTNPSWIRRIGFTIYKNYLQNQKNLIQKRDPFSFKLIETHSKLSSIVLKETFVSQMKRPMKYWKGFYGVGSLMFGFFLFNGISTPEILICVRLFFLNVLFFFFVFPMQRKASKQVYDEWIKLSLNDSTGDIKDYESLSRI